MISDVQMTLLKEQNSMRSLYTTQSFIVLLFGLKITKINPYSTAVILSSNRIAAQHFSKQYPQYKF